MINVRHLLNPAVAATLAALMWLAAPASASERVSELLAQLANPEQPRWQRVERELLAEWSKSGSAAIDLLLKRGREALESGDDAAAVEHLTAAIDHAPDFAEAYNLRATAYFRGGRIGPALEDIGMALSLNPHHFGALTGLGMIMEDTGRTAQALAVFRAAHAIHPHQPAIRRSLERLERSQGGFDA